MSHVESLESRTLFTVTWTATEGTLTITGTANADFLTLSIAPDDASDADWVPQIHVNGTEVPGLGDDDTPIQYFLVNMGGGDDWISFSYDPDGQWGDGAINGEGGNDTFNYSAWEGTSDISLNGGDNNDTFNQTGNGGGILNGDAGDDTFNLSLPTTDWRGLDINSGTGSDNKLIVDGVDRTSNVNQGGSIFSGYLTRDTGGYFWAGANGNAVW